MDGHSPQQKKNTSENTHDELFTALWGGGGGGREIGVDEDFHPPSQVRCKLTLNVIIECP
jgi:hypothetical protein